MINFSSSNLFLAVFWMSGFVILTFNVGYMFISSLVSFLLKEDRLKEKDLWILPPTAIVYVVRNEEEEVLLNSMYGSFRDNFREQVDLWLLSNSDLEEYIDGEKRVISTLRKYFGENRVRYFQTRKNPLRRKHICIQEWLAAYPEYKYFLVCDADSRLSSDSLLRLVQKAEHPENRDVVVFQSQINIQGATTYFAKFLGYGQDICQRIYARASQKVFRRGVSYGSGCLIRCREFSEIGVPDWVLSHDIWDTVLLEEKKYRVVFCGDVKTFGKFPSNYVECLKRNRRWIMGTLESLGIILRKKISTGTRFMALYPIYIYLSQPIFLLWIIAGFFLDSKLWDTLFTVQRYALLGANYMDLEMGSHLFMTLFIITGHRFIKCKNIKEMGMVFLELTISLLICLNSIFFDSLVVFEWLLKGKKGMSWVPMKKKDDQPILFSIVARKLWPTTLLGIAGLILGSIYSPVWVTVVIPFLCSFILGIPVTYLTGRPIKGTTRVEDQRYLQIPPDLSSITVSSSG
ncbi:MAG TPA: glycosyltransferase family 2 protein [Candidatus Limnocylindrales bacterium]|nr:glycosyltransferase family 2 protein [Candidatus Limnocylindrales bacterium]